MCETALRELRELIATLNLRIGQLEVTRSRSRPDSLHRHTLLRHIVDLQNTLAALRSVCCLTAPEPDQ